MNNVQFLIFASALSFGACATDRTLFDIYSHGEYQSVMDHCLPKAQEGDSRCGYIVASLYWYGQGVAKDMQLAAQWMQKASDGNNRYAQLALGEMLMSGTGLRKNESAAVTLWKKAAAQNLPQAQYNLYGYYADKKPEESMRWLEKAAANNMTTAQITLGTKLCMRKDKPDCNTAIKWLQLAAKTGNTIGERSLGFAYSKLRQSKKAEKFLLRAAMKGDVTSQTMLGTLYLSDNDTTDIDNACKWFLVAKINNDPTANLMLSTLSATISEKEFQQAKEAASELTKIIASRKQNPATFCPLQKDAFAKK